MLKSLAVPATLLLAACGVEFIKPATPAELSSYPTVIAFAQNRYTSFRAAMGTAQWWQGSKEDVEVAVFRISSNATGWLDDQAAFERDMADFCSAHHGQYSTLFKPDSAKIAAALMHDQAGSAAGVWLRERNGNPPTFSCSASGHEYVFYGEAIFHPEPKDGVSIKVRLNQGVGGTSLSRSTPSVQ